MFYKPEHRKALREKRNHLDKASIQQAAKRVATQIILLPKFIESKTIAFYMPIENELDPMPIIQAAEQFEKTFYLPVVSEDDDNALSFYPFHSPNSLVKNRYGILEPKTDEKKAIDTQALDIILLPLVGFDEPCNRIGRGAGYYDHSLAFAKDKPSEKRPLLIGLAYEFQKLSEIVPSKWDVPLDIVVTESTVYTRNI